MAMKILDNCTNCAACEEECPPGAIRRGDDTYVVNSDACTLCEGEFAAPRCVELCPIDGCIVPAAA